MNPKRLFPHPRPKASYIANPEMGKSAPSNDLKMARAAVHEAAYAG